MKRSRFTQEQIIGVLKEHPAGSTEVREALRALVARVEVYADRLSCWAS